MLVAAALASAIGQLSKPLTSAIYGKGIDPKASVRPGGMPSTHSAVRREFITSVAGFI